MSSLKDVTLGGVSVAIVAATAITVTTLAGTVLYVRACSAVTSNTE